MLTLFNSLGKRMEAFRPANPNVVHIFTCGPSVYQRAHIGNHRTFLFEDILVRYLEYLGFRVRRGMNFTDIEDKALIEARKTQRPLADLTAENIDAFLGEMKTLGMKIPDYLPRASEHVTEAVEIVGKLVERGVAYRHGGNVYFDPLKFPGFGRIYGLDMTAWPEKKVRFHRDTYNGLRWNRGDFILWHGCGTSDRVCWDSPFGSGWPAWNIQDPSMVAPYIDETLSVYCGGIDNLIRHHDYSAAILESIRPYPMAKYWLHCRHLFVNGKKMSKSTGNILYTDSLRARGYSPAEIRFFLIYGRYGKKMNYEDALMAKCATRLRALRDLVGKIRAAAGNAAPADCDASRRLLAVFAERMDDNLDVKGAVDGIGGVLSGLDVGRMTPPEASAVTAVVGRMDGVFRVLA